MLELAKQKYLSIVVAIADQLLGEKMRGDILTTEKEITKSKFRVPIKYPMRKGLYCIFCGVKTEVTDTRNQVGYVRRYRECPKCGWRSRTREVFG